ncbi:condensation domain-containing protein, partial [Serratia fonticola]
VMFAVQNFGENETDSYPLPFQYINENDNNEIFALANFDLSSFVNDGQFDLSLSVNDGHTALTGTVSYLECLFESSTINRIIQLYKRILAQFIISPTIPIKNVQLLTDVERTLLDGWNRTDAPYPQDKTLHQLFEEQVIRTPERIALAFENESLTYHELNIRAN